MLNISNEMSKSNIKLFEVKKICFFYVCSVLFIVCLYICVCECLFKTTIIKLNIKIILIAGLPSRQALSSGLPYNCTSICVRASCTQRASCVDSKPKAKKCACGRASVRHGVKALDVLTWQIRHDDTLRHQICSLPCTCSALLSHIPSDASFSIDALMHAMHSAAPPVYHVHAKHCMTPYCTYSTQPGVVSLHVAFELLHSFHLFAS